MNINGNKEGPVLKKVYSCEECKYFSEYRWLENRCLHPILVNKYSGLDINRSKETPVFCPFLIKEMRKEKLNILNDRTKQNL